MSEDSTEQQTPKVFTEDEVNRIVQDRLKREDVKGLKARITELEAANGDLVSERDGLGVRVGELEARAGGSDLTAARYRVGLEKGLSIEDVETFLTGPDVDAIGRQADALRSRLDGVKQGGNTVPNEGTGDHAVVKDADLRSVVNGLFGSN